MRKLEMLAEAENGMSPEQKKEFENYFLGAIALLTKEEDWESALATAKRCVRRPEVTRG